MHKFNTPAPISAVLDIPGGRVQFIAADRADTAVEVLPANASKDRDVKAAQQAEVGYADSLSAGTGYGRISNHLNNDGTAELDIHATTSRGDIAARSL